MSTAKRRRESSWKQRKQHPNPHGRIKSLEEYADEIGAVPSSDEAIRSSSNPPSAE
ncbi:hypothetical protein HGI30_02575 [Paenibacillus albicereus]|uniref:Uncharacterized protein n=1 Tax=Paenibacillus albicereus TaxID=2726185 RepID=A0A6H2GTU0_9BACL|nr:DUF6254 family protein [Paenibacillus albicereus]QJC50586.1 hypothetical protein HGI30_02575 [Paenibacillus albicereus]